MKPDEYKTEIKKMHEQIEEMRKLAHPIGFFEAYYAQLKYFKTGTECFESLNRKYYDYFGYYKYSDFNSFRNVRNRMLKTFKKKK